MRRSRDSCGAIRSGSSRSTATSGRRCSCRSIRRGATSCGGRIGSVGRKVVVQLGVAVRSMGPQSQPDVLLACVRAAERAGLADVWVQDHLAIPPDDAEGSGGRYLDPLTALAWLAGAVPRIGLGTGVLNLPYRPALPTAKAIATLQEVSAGRLRLGVGVGWMEAEFRALGVPRTRRGRLADETRLVAGARYATADEFARHVAFLAERVVPALPR